MDHYHLGGDQEKLKLGEEEKPFERERDLVFRQSQSERIYIKRERSEKSDRLSRSLAFTS